MSAIPPVLKPDPKSLVWLAIGTFLVPKFIAKVRP